MKGEAGAGKQPVSNAKHTGKTRSLFFTVGVDTIKDHLQARLTAEEKKWHFASSLDGEWFAQLRSERVELKYTHGRPTRVYKQTRQRNEALDCVVYSWAALHVLNPDFERIKEKREQVQDHPRPAKRKRSYATAWRR